MLFNVRSKLNAFLTTYILVSIWNGLSAIQPPDIKVLKPRGLKFTVKDDGYSVVYIRYNLNKPIESSKDIQRRQSMRKTGKYWKHVNNTVTVLSGDRIYYEISGRKGPYGEDEVLQAVYEIPKQKDHHSDEDFSADDDDDSDDDTVYIVIGVVLGVALTAFVVFLLWYIFYYRKRNESKDKTKQEQNKQPTKNNNDRYKKETKTAMTSDGLKNPMYNSKHENIPKNSDHFQNENIYEYIKPEEMDMTEENKGQGYFGLSQSQNTRTENESYEKLRHPQYLEIIG